MLMSICFTPVVGVSLVMVYLALLGLPIMLGKEALKSVARLMVDHRKISQRNRNRGDYDTHNHNCGSQLDDRKTRLGTFHIAYV
jgi:hypothetical protein